MIALAEHQHLQEQELHLDSLLDAEAVMDRLHARGPRAISSCRIGYVRYYPSQSALVRYDIEYSDERGSLRQTSVYAKAIDSLGWAAARAKAKSCKWSKSGLGAGFFESVEDRTLFFEYPNDLEMPGLRILGNHNLLKEFLGKGKATSRSTTFRCLKYKPESRCIMVDEGDTTFVKLDRLMDKMVSPGMVCELADTFSGDPTIGVPPLLSYSNELMISVLPRVEGNSLLSLMQQSDVSPTLVGLFNELPRLHDFRSSRLRQVDFRDAMMNVFKCVNLIGHAGSEFQCQVRDISRRLHSLLAKPQKVKLGFVHGDFHPAQVIVNNGRYWFIDFGKSHYGDCVADLGNFFAQLAHMRLKKLIESEIQLQRKCIEAYERASDSKISFDSFNFWKAAGLIELGAKQFRGLRPMWRERLAHILQECQSILDGA